MLMKYSKEAKSAFGILLGSVVIIAAVAGYAYGKQVLENFTELFKKRLESKKFESPSIGTKIRAGAQISKEDSYFDAAQKLLSSRISILAVIDQDDSEEVIGVFVKECF